MGVVRVAPTSDTKQHSQGETVFGDRWVTHVKELQQTQDLCSLYDVIHVVIQYLTVSIVLLAQLKDLAACSARSRVRHKTCRRTASYAEQTPRQTCCWADLQCLRH